MKMIYKHNMGNGAIYEETVCNVSSSVCTSLNALRLMFATHASRKQLGYEGRDWRFKPNNPGCMIPFYVSTNDGFSTLEIM